MIGIDWPEWMDQALCAQTDPEVFFPELGRPNKSAKRTCARCDVQAQCLEYALENEESWGIWGGTSTKERSQILGKRIEFISRNAGGVES